VKPALLLIDLQRHFQDNYDCFKGKLIPNIEETLAVARRADVKIIHAITKYRADKSDWPEAFKERDRIWCLEDSDESGIIAGLGPLRDEALIVKKRFTAFYGTELSALLKGSMIDTLFLCGFAADGCVRFTTMDAYNEGYAIYWLRDCLGSAWEELDASLAYMKRLTRLKDISKAEFVEMLEFYDRG
jgi:nicotinamidase-related amidase